MLLWMLNVLLASASRASGIQPLCSDDFAQVHPESAWVLFTPDRSSALKSLPTWSNNPICMFLCDAVDGDSQYAVGEGTSTCLEGYEITLQSEGSAPQRLQFSGSSGLSNITIDQVLEIRTFFEDSAGLHFNDSSYVFGVPISVYATPNALQTYQLSFNDTNGVPMTALVSSIPQILNQFNATGITLRDYSGVPAELQGTGSNVQATGMLNGDPVAVNETSQNEFLELLGLSSYEKLQFGNTTLGWPENNCMEYCSTDLAYESALDIAAMQAFAPQAKTIYFPSNSSFPPDISEDSEGYTVFLEEFLNQANYGDIWSISWFVGGISPEDWANSTGGILPMEAQLERAAKLGVTILVSSGDSGATSDQGEQCSSAYEPFEGVYDGWPITSPWVTVVGGTQFLANPSTLETEEVVCSTETQGGITSGGGFVAKYIQDALNQSMPLWQKPHVERYLRENNASTFNGFPTIETPGFNPEGRAFPDIAQYAGYTPILNPYSGKMQLQAGTSYSAPSVAGLFSLANQKLIADGYNAIGYANPMLYWMADNCPQAFNDITKGNNQYNDYQQPNQKCLYGYPAAPGWDAATGLGSIRFEPFVECVKKYQDHSSPSSIGSTRTTSRLIISTVSCLFSLWVSK